MSERLIRILLADDHAVVRAGFRRLLEQRPEIRVLAEAVSGEDAYRLYGVLKPDVVVMDLSMPGMGGMGTIRRIVARDPSARILVFSIHESEAFALQALKSGALGYLTKAAAPDVIVTAVHEVARGRPYLAPDVAQRIALYTATGADDPLACLTAREFEVFQLVVDGRTIDQIAEALHLSSKTVANYATQIKQKLGVSSPVELVRLALKHRVISD
ncbi:response regulator [Pelomicrobium methylotrophicum]|uniref:Response regulator transcription factor n=1 Tax=Pelomicrobium methylotrophicum TaxID=2602750 RepID=A0A5C7EW22_9PROT|nr:response regulator transcription factor [Pelomicrobium methylotrophicum]TXF12594.1 response regulator transcription factor [Pelomicrobium methylotrophicum]